MFSHRTDWSFTSNPLMSTFHALKEKKIEILDLTASNPTHAGFYFSQEEILRPLSEQANMHYMPEPLGDFKARQAICDMYARQGFCVTPAQVVLTSSSSEAYSFLFRLLLNPQEAVLFPRPSYPLFDFLAQLNDVNIQYYPLAYHQGWGVDEQGLQASVTANTKVLVMVHPNNPTGSFIKEKELAAINEICVQNNLAIVCDEVFLDYIFNVEKFKVKSFVDNKSVLTFTLGGLSKSLGLPQMKLSWIVVSGPQEKVDDALRRLEIIADTYLSVNTPSQNALSHWFLQKEEIQKQVKTRLENNKKVLTGVLSKTSLQLLHGEGGWYAVVRLPDAQSEERWVMDLLEHHHVFVHPGYFFDFQDGSHLVLSYLTPEDIFQQGAERIVNYSMNG